MSKSQRSFRRVVTGVNADGKSYVVADSDAPNSRPNPVVPGTGMTEFWCFAGVPIDLRDDTDFGLPPFTNDPPQYGAFLRYVESAKVPDNYDPENDPTASPLHEPKFDPKTGRGERGGRNKGKSPVHMTRSVDYGFMIDGQRTLILDKQKIALQKGDVVIQLGDYHAWGNPEDDSIMGYVMIGGTYDE